MKREIKFRYRYTDGKEWIMLFFTLDDILNGGPFDHMSDNPLLKKYKHVGEDQWTGLKDCNGAEIYEGDVVDDGHMIHEVEFMHFLRNVTNAELRRMKVIGNRFVNPELVKS